MKVLFRAGACNNNYPQALDSLGEMRRLIFEGRHKGIEIPPADQHFYALKDVPHGRASQIFFPSKSTHTNNWMGQGCAFCNKIQQ